jgi:hypothetical protein
MKKKGKNQILDIENELEKYNPTLKSVLRIENLFRENIEFASKNQILRKLDGSMKASVLNVILKYLKSIGKVTENQDKSWTWIYAADNEKLKKSFSRAVRL